MSVRTPSADYFIILLGVCLNNKIKNLHLKFIDHFTCAAMADAMMLGYDKREIPWELPNTRKVSDGA